MRNHKKIGKLRKTPKFEVSDSKLRFFPSENVKLRRIGLPPITGGLFLFGRFKSFEVLGRSEKISNSDGNFFSDHRTVMNSERPKNSEGKLRSFFSKFRSFSDG